MADASLGTLPPATWEYSPAPETVPVTIPERTQLFIGGRFVEPHSKKRFATVNPATEATLSQIAEGDAADVDTAVSASRKAFKGWSKLRRELLIELLKQSFDQPQGESPSPAPLADATTQGGSFNRDEASRMERLLLLLLDHLQVSPLLIEDAWRGPIKS